MVVEAIGKGGFGHVFKAIHAETGETVAIKRIALDSIPKDQLSGIMVKLSTPFLHLLTDVDGDRATEASSAQKYREIHHIY